MKLLIDLAKGEEPKRSTKSPLERLQRAKEGYDHPDANSLAESYAKWCEANNLSNEEFESSGTPMKTLQDLYKLDDGERYNLKGTGLEGVVNRGQAFILTGLPDFEIPDDSLGKSLVTLSKAINRGKLVQRMVMVHRADGSIVRRMQWVDPSDRHSPHDAPHVAIVTPTVAKMHINRYEAGEPDQGFERYLEHNGIDVNDLEHVSKDNPVVLPMTNEFSQKFMEQMSMVHPNWKTLGKQTERVTEEELDDIMRRHETGDYSDEPKAKYPGDEGWQEVFDSNHSSTPSSDYDDDDFEDDPDEEFEDDFDDEWESRESHKSTDSEKQEHKENVASGLPFPYDTPADSVGANTRQDAEGRDVHTVANMEEYAEKHGRVTPDSYLDIDAYRAMGRPEFLKSERDYVKPTPMPHDMIPEEYTHSIPKSEMPADAQSRINRSLSLNDLYAMGGQDPVIPYNSISYNIACDPKTIKAMYDVTGGLSREAWAKVFSHPDGVTYTTNPADIRMHYDGSLGGTFTVSAEVRDRYNRPVAIVKRSFYKNNPLTVEVHNDFLQVNDIANGTRVADNMYERVETLLPQIAAKNDLRSCITIHANITVGKYAWAKKEKGFDFANTDSRDTMWGMTKRMCKQMDIDLNELLEHNGYTSIFELNRPHQFRDLKWKHNFELRNGNDDNASFGKALLFDYADDWNAVKWIAKDAEHLTKKHSALIDDWGEGSDEYDYDDIDDFLDTAGYEPRPAKPLPESLANLNPGVLDQLGIRR